MDCGRHVVGVVHSEGLGTFTFTTGSLEASTCIWHGRERHADIEVSVCSCHLPAGSGGTGSRGWSQVLLQ